MNKLLTYYSFIVVTVVVISGFMGASSLPQLISALLFYPMLVYFFSLVNPKSQKTIPPPLQPSKNGQILKPVIEEVYVKAEKPKSYDLNRRAFLKLIGTAGTSLFLFSIFTNKAKAAFFGSVPGPGTVAIKDTTGTAIDPAEKGPTDGYAISQADADSLPAYYGYVDKDGAWYIMKEAADGSYVYVKGSSGFSGEWATRAVRVDYDTFDQIF